MAGNKTLPTKLSAATFIKKIRDPVRRQDCQRLAKMMREIVGKNATMWGSRIVGFGQYHYRYASGREGDFMLTGFSPGTRNLTIYIMSGFDNYESLMNSLGKYKTGKSCLYVRKLDDIDEKVLATLIEKSVRDMRKRYNSQ